MLFLNQNVFRNSPSKEQIEEFFTRYGMTFAYQPDFLLADERVYNGWLVNEIDIKFMGAITGHNYTARDVRRTPLEGVNEFVMNQNTIILPRTDFARLAAVEPRDEPVYTELGNEYAAQNMQEIFEKPMVVVVGNGHTTRSVNNVFLNEYVNVSINMRYIPEGQTDDRVRVPTVDAPTSFFGVNTRFPFKGFAPAPGADYNIVEGGVVVAQMFAGKYLVVLFPFICHADIPEHSEILKHILRKVARSANANAPGVDIAFLKFVKADVLEKRKRELRNEQSSAQSNARSYSDELTKFLRKYNEASVELQAIEMGESTLIPSDENLTKEVAQITGMKGVKSISVSRDKKKVFVFTETIYVNNDRHKTRHVIGDFKITINLNKPVDQTLIFQNLTRQGHGGHHAPHVSSNGTACLGNLNEMLPPFIATVDIAMLIQLAISFVETINYPDQWGQYIESFPVVDKEGNILDPAGSTRYAAFQTASFKMPADYAPDGVHKSHRKKVSAKAAKAELDALAAAIPVAVATA